jgi:hypothetical protein
VTARVVREGPPPEPDTVSPEPVPVPPAPTPVYDVELLRNPGCEEPFTNRKIPGWENISGRWCPLSDPKPQSGEAFFCPGGEGPEGELRQDVDVSAYAAAIDAGRQEFVFRGYVRSLDQPNANDITRIRVEYHGKDATAAPLDAYRSGPQYSPKDWRLLSDIRMAPRGTRTIRVVLLSIRAKVSGVRSNDGWFDDLSLRARPPDKPVARFVPLFAGRFDNNLLTEDIVNKGRWTVENGVLVGHGAGDLKKPAVLVTRRGDYQDFTLRMELRKSDVDSHSILIRGSDADGKAAGYVIQTGALFRPNERSGAVGTIWKARDLVAADAFIGQPAWADAVPLRDGEVYTVEVTAVGDTITTFANGKKVAEFADKTAPFRRGPIRFMCRNDTTGRYQKIEIKEFPPAAPAGRFALRFDGQKTWVRIPQSVFEFDGKSSLTIEAVVTPSACAAQHNLLCTTAGESGFTLKLSADDGWTFNVHTGGGNNDRNRNPAPPVVGKRTVVAAVYDQAKNETRLYIDGKLNGATQSLGKRKPRNGPWDKIMGANPQKGNRFEYFYAGTFEYLRVSKSARYAADYDPAPAPTADPDTLLLYLFDEGAGDVLRDASGRGYNGSIANGSWVRRTAP